MHITLIKFRGRSFRMLHNTGQSIVDRLLKLGKLSFSVKPVKTGLFQLPSATVKILIFPSILGIFLEFHNFRRLYILIHLAMREDTITFILC